MPLISPRLVRYACLPLVLSVSLAAFAPALWAQDAEPSAAANAPVEATATDAPPAAELPADQTTPPDAASADTAAREPVQTVQGADSKSSQDSDTDSQPSAQATEPPPVAAPALSLHQQASLDACVEQAAPQQYGGPAFADLQPDLALAACEQAWQALPENLGTISAYIGRIMEAQDEFTAAYWLYRRAVADDLPVGYGLLAYRLMRQGDDDAKAALLAETGHALGDWNASNVLATLYAQDRVPGKGPGDALALIEYVAEQGSPFAQYLTAWLYETHKQAPDKALIWYEKAVENGEQAAAAFLADLLERGVAAREADGDRPAIAEITPDYPRAAELYWRALQRGDAWAAQQFIARGKDRPAPVMLAIQQRLAAEGFSVGAPDGVFGRRTEQALRDLLARTSAKN